MDLAKAEFRTVENVFCVKELILELVPLDKVSKHLRGTVSLVTKDNKERNSSN